MGVYAARACDGAVTGGVGTTVGLNSMQNERNGGSSATARFRVRLKGNMKMLTCARTTAARTWRDADEEHKDQDPEF